MGEPYRAKVLRARGQGSGEAGRRSRAVTSVGRTVRASAVAAGRLHLPATIRAAALSSGPEAVRRVRCVSPVGTCSER